jgi:hypothetical protein
MIEVWTDDHYWWFHYQYKGMNIDVAIDKEISTVESALANATWVIHDAICDLDK